MELKTAQEWLAYGDDLPVKLAKVFTPGPHSHDFYGGKDEPSEKCLKCNLDEDTVECFCSVPDPITIDWNEAKYRQSQCDEYMFLAAAQQVRKVLFPEACTGLGWVRWWLTHLCKPEDAKYVIIAAAMATERSKE